MGRRGGQAYLSRTSLSLQVEDPGGQALRRHNHATSVWQVSLAFVLDLQICHLAWVEGAWQLGSQREVGVVEVNNEFALLVEWVLEVDSDGFGAWCASDGTLRLRSLRFAEQKARVFHALGARQLEHATAVPNREWLVADVELDFNTFLVLSCRRWHLGHISLEVARSWAIDPFDFDRVVGWLFEEVEEFERLHLVLSESALESQRSLGSRRETFEQELVVEVS